MSTHDISDNDLDGFFRESAENSAIPPDEGAWRKLEGKLNQHRSLGFKRVFTALVSCMLLFSTTSLNVGNTNIKRPSLQATATLSKGFQTTIEPHKAGTPNKNTLANTTRIGTKHQTIAQNKDSFYAKNESEHSQDISPSAKTKRGSIKPEKTRSNLTSSKKGKTANVVQELSSVESANAFDYSPRKDKQESSPVSSNKENETQPLHESVKREAASPTQLIGGSKDSALIQQTTVVTLPVTDTLAKAPKRPIETKPRQRRVSVGLLVSPDFTTVGVSKMQNPGMAGGIFAEYHVTNRWTMVVGFIRAFKTYSATNGNGYNADEGYWEYKNNTSSITGSCNVIDVPINVKYHVIANGKNYVFLSTGLSSYFMRNQKYSFVYEYDNKNAVKSWESTEKDNYYFGVANFSIGYERFLSKSISVQVEPFLKVPLQNVGAGQAKLLTTGMFISLKYTLHERK